MPSFFSWRVKKTFSWSSALIYWMISKQEILCLSPRGKNSRELIIEAVESIIILPKSFTNICRDSQDDHILAWAKSGETEYPVTGDNDLLVLGQFEGVKIITPKAFEMLFT